MPPANTCCWLRVKLPYRAVTATSTCISFLLLSVSLLSPSWMEAIIPETSLSPSPTINKLCNNMACSRLSGSSGSSRKQSRSCKPDVRPPPPVEDPLKKTDFTKASKILLTLATIAGFVAAFSLLISSQCLRRCGGPPNILVSSAASFATGILGFTTMALYTVDVAQKEVSSLGNLHFTWSFCLAWLVFTLYVMNGFFSLMTHLLSAAPGTEQHISPILLGGRMQQQAAGDYTAVGLPVLPSQEAAVTSARNPFPSPSICLNSAVI